MIYDHQSYRFHFFLPLLRLTEPLQTRSDHGSLAWLRNFKEPWRGTTCPLVREVGRVQLYCSASARVEHSNAGALSHLPRVRETAPAGVEVNAMQIVTHKRSDAIARLMTLC